MVAATVLIGGCATHHNNASTVAASSPRPSLAPGPSAAIPSRGVSSHVLPGSAQDFVVNVGDRVYFDYNQYAIRADARPLLSAQADWLNRYPTVQIRIDGNCDERGTREYNLALGARRADSVREFLVAHGVAPSRITTISYGKEHPIDPGASEDAWQHDRNGHTGITGGAG
jgi:peptidoglycan-associated lipoprotein